MTMVRSLETGAMPQTTIVFSKEEDGQVPVLAWLRTLHRRDRHTYVTCIARIQRLAARLLLDSRVVGFADVIQPNSCYPFLLEALLFQSLWVRFLEACFGFF